MKMVCLADVYAALSYYHDHFEEIRKQMQDDAAFAQEMQEQTPSLVKEKLSQQHDRQD
ncbi:MAG: hypothetical protein QNJ33_19240 [Crocosphaera sp.]|nr:hypothetical protein [Crocosphaera sp.]